jgi:hypothetical protein
MEYTVQKLAKLAGTSTRTLRYYDEIGILKPARINSSGYRIDQSNKNLLNMTQEQYDRFEKLGQEVLVTLEDAYKTGDPAGKLGQKVADLHKQWLCFTWSSYSKEAHAGLAQMYVDDERFTAYCDKKQPGLAKFLRDAVLIYTGTEE